MARYATPKKRTNSDQVALRITEDDWIRNAHGTPYRKGAIIYVSRSNADGLLAEHSIGGVVEITPRKSRVAGDSVKASDRVAHTPSAGTVYGPPVAPWWHARRWLPKPDMAIVHLTERVQFGSPSQAYGAGLLIHVSASRAAELVEARYAVMLEPKDIAPSDCRPDVLVQNASGALRWANADCLARAIDRTVPETPPAPQPPLVPDGMQRVCLRELTRFGDGWFGPGWVNLSDERAEAAIAGGFTHPTKVSEAAACPV